MLQSGKGPHAQPRHERAFGPHPRPRAIVLFLVERILATRERSAHLEPRQHTEWARRTVEIELRAHLLRASPRHRERQTTVGANRRGPRRADAVAEAVAVLEIEHGQELQRQTALADDTGRTIPLGLDGHRSLIENDHEGNLARVRNRGKSLQHVHLLEALRQAEPGRNLLRGVRRDGRSDRNARQADDFLVWRQDVTLNPDLPQHLRRRRGRLQ